MTMMCKLIRFFGLLLGLFYLTSSLADIAGFIPYSEATPPLVSRLSSNLPSLMSGIVLLLPQRLFLQGWRYFFLLAAYALVSASVLALTLQGISAYFAGGKHWLIVPVSIGFFVVPAANALGLWFFHRRMEPPNNSFKPKPLRGSA